MNKVIDLIKSRASCPKLTSPAPLKEEVEQILMCAMRAPDHARLKTWKYHVLQGESLSKLGEVFAETLESGVAQDKVEKCRNMPLRAPLMIVAVCEPQDNPKVPSIEQILSVGAGIQNMQIAISSLGYGSIWRTGDMAHSKLVKEHFNVSDKGAIVGFLYVGTPERQSNPQNVDITEYVKYWD